MQRLTTLSRQAYEYAFNDLASVPDGGNSALKFAEDTMYSPTFYDILRAPLENQLALYNSLKETLAFDPVIFYRSSSRQMNENSALAKTANLDVLDIIQQNKREWDSEERLQVSTEKLLRDSQKIANFSRQLSGIQKNDYRALLRQAIFLGDPIRSTIILRNIDSSFWLRDGQWLNFHDLVSAGNVTTMKETLKAYLGKRLDFDPSLLPSLQRQFLDPAGVVDGWQKNMIISVAEMEFNNYKKKIRHEMLRKFAHIVLSLRKASTSYKIPKQFVNEIIYKAEHGHLCDTIAENQLPSIFLQVFASHLSIPFDDTTNMKDLCQNIARKLYPIPEAVKEVSVREQAGQQYYEY